MISHICERRATVPNDKVLIRHRYMILSKIVDIERKYLSDRTVVEDYLNKKLFIIHLISEIHAAKTISDIDTLFEDALYSDMYYSIVLETK
jgi:hypothetical protein